MPASEWRGKNKKSGIFSLWILGFSLLGLGITAWGDWEQLGGSLNVSENQNAANPHIAVYNDTPYATWNEEGKIYVKYYSEADRSWVQLGECLNASLSEMGDQPDIVFCGDIPYVTWLEGTWASGKRGVYVKYYHENQWIQAGGNSLNCLVGGMADSPCIVNCNGLPYVGWAEYVSSAWDSFVKYYSGTDWVQAGNGLNAELSVVNFLDPVLAAGNGRVYVIGYDNSTAHTHVGYFNGSAWVKIGDKLEFSPCSYHYSPAMAFLRSTPYINSGSDNVTVKYYEGDEWITSADLSIYDAVRGIDPAMTGDGNRLYITWNEANQIFVKYYNGSDWMLIGNRLNLDQACDASHSDIACSPSKVFVAWLEKNLTEGKTQIYVKALTINPASSSGTSEFPVAAYPNPAKDKAHIMWLETNVQEACVEVYNMSGERVATLKSENSSVTELIWDLKGIAPGVYIYRVLLTIDGQKRKGVNKIAVVR